MSERASLSLGFPVSANVLSACENLRLVGRRSAAERLLANVEERAAKALVSPIDPREAAAYREIEAENTDKIAGRLRTLLEDEVLPMAVEYVESRFPEESKTDFPRFDTVSLELRSVASSDENLSEPRLPPHSGTLGTCGMLESGNEEVDVRISLDLDAFFFVCSHKGKDLSDPGAFDEFATQVLLHETVHAISTTAYLQNRDRWMTERKWLSFLDSLGEYEPCSRKESIVSRFGYSLNFTTPAEEEERLASFPLANLYNEALTDIIAARAYSYRFKTRGIPAKRYGISYGPESKAFHIALEDFAARKGLDKNELFRTIERGYFFSDDDFFESWRNAVRPMLNDFREILEEMGPDA